MSLKKCSKCHQEKPITEFFKSGKYPSGKDRIRGDCKDCAKKNTASWRIKNRSHYNNYVAHWRAKNPEKQHAIEIKRLYGLSADNYRALLDKQNNKCAICKKEHDPKNKRGRLYVDHCHDSRRVRGLLCSFCNSAIGYLRHDQALIKSALSYLSA